MKVLHIFNSLMPSGAEKMWHDAARILSSRGIETHVVATDSNLGDYADVMRDCGFCVHHVRHFRRRLIDVRYAIRIYRLIRTNRIDVVQIHPEAWRLTNVVIAWCAGVRKISTTVHSAFRYKGIGKFRRILAFWIMRCLGCCIVAISDTVRGVERQYRYNPLLIYNWIDIDRFVCKHDGEWRLAMRKALHIPAAIKLIALVGNCADVKNHEFMVRVLLRLPNEYHVLHVGRENDITDRERALARELSVLTRIHYLGMREDVADLLELSEVFVMCSKYEGLGNACIEALAMGLPAVVSNVNGLRDLARLVPSCEAVGFDEVEFANAIQRAVKKGNQYDVRQIVKEKFDMTSNIQQYLRLWGVI